jgi:hypothetical protein
MMPPASMQIEGLGSAGPYPTRSGRPTATMIKRRSPWTAGVRAVPRGHHHQWQARRTTSRRSTTSGIARHQMWTSPARGRRLSASDDREKLFGLMDTPSGRSQPRQRRPGSPPRHRLSGQHDGRGFDVIRRARITPSNSPSCDPARLHREGDPSRTAARAPEAVREGAGGRLRSTCHGVPSTRR